jgi:hypothetical protein
MAVDNVRQRFECKVESPRAVFLCMRFFGMGKVEMVALMANQGKRIHTLDMFLRGIAGGAEDFQPHNSLLERRKEMCKTRRLLSILQ